MKKKENIIIFGTGKYFERKKETILKSYNVVLFLDNYQKDRIANIPVISPNDLPPDNDVKIFLMSVHFIAMWKQLISLHVSPERLVFPFDMTPYFEGDAELVNLLDKISFKENCFSCDVKCKGSVDITNEVEWLQLLREAYRKYYPLIGELSRFGTEPISKQFATERGTPIDRYYIEKFLTEYQRFIKGDVLEVEDDSYTNKFDNGQIDKHIIMNVDSNATNLSFVCNLENGEGVREAVADCFILTQTLMYIFDLPTAVNNIYRLLKTDGVLLATCSGISQNSRRCMDNYGCCFNFNAAALQRLFGDVNRFEVISAGSYGNVKTVMAHIAGLCQEDLCEDDFLTNDKYYPLIAYVVVRKK